MSKRLLVAMLFLAAGCLVVSGATFAPDDCHAQKDGDKGCCGTCDKDEKGCDKDKKDCDKDKKGCDKDGDKECCGTCGKGDAKDDSGCKKGCGK